MDGISKWAKASPIVKPEVDSSTVVNEQSRALVAQGFSFAKARPGGGLGLTLVGGWMVFATEQVGMQGVRVNTEVP